MKSVKAILLTIFLWSSAWAQTSYAPLVASQLQLVSSLSQYGLQPQWYLSEDFQLKLDAVVATDDLAAVEKLVTPVAEKIASDLGRGRVLPTVGRRRQNQD